MGHETTDEYVLILSKKQEYEHGGCWWVENNMGSSFHVNDDQNERYTFIAHIDDEKKQTEQR